MTLRVLFLGESWQGSCARACSASLRRLRCDVHEVDERAFLPRAESRLLRGTMRVLRPWLVREYNRAVVRAARDFGPDLVLAFKGPYVSAETLAELRRLGIPTYNYYPDTSPAVHGPWLPDALPEYDCVFYTKCYWDEAFRRSLRLRRAAFLPHGYDPEIHRPWEIDARERARLAHAVTVVATYTRHKEQVLAGLLERLPDLDLCIWGHQWRERAVVPAVRRRVQGLALTGPTYAKALQASAINLAIMSGTVAGAPQGDETTTRTFEIPASGGFMLHERTREVCELFEEGQEVACFASPDELARQVRHYLAEPSEREAMRDAGFRRCVPAYSYEQRMATLLAWHRERR